MNINSPAPVGRLRSAWDQGKQRGQRQRDIAAALDVSEAELVASACGDFGTRLKGDFRQLLAQLGAIGRAMALTRNDGCVHEKTGVYENLSFEGHVGLALGDNIDLRLFMRNWKSGYALREPAGEGVRESLQFFDGSGTAVHKVFPKPDSDRAAFDRLVAAFAASDQSPGHPLTAPTSVTPPDAMQEIDRDAFLHDWSQMEDTHQFFGLLKRFKLSRAQALELAAGAYTRELVCACAREVLEGAAAGELPIMVFVGNRGCIQIHTGLVSNVKITGEWVNVLDPGFSLHLRPSAVARAWCVTKPTNDGPVTSLELLDRNGEPIATFFGRRKPGIPEMAEWRALASAIRQA